MERINFIVGGMFARTSDRTAGRIAALRRRQIMTVAAGACLAIGNIAAANVTLLTFEEAIGNDAMPISTFYSGVTFTADASGSEWVFRDATTGNYNVSSWPSGEFGGEYWIHGYGAATTALDDTGNNGRIIFNNADASFVEISYSFGSGGGSSLTLSAYDTNDQLLDSDIGPPNLRFANNNPNGPGTLRVEAPDGQDIAYVIVSNGGNFWVIDNVMTDASGIVNHAETWHPIEDGLNGAAHAVTEFDDGEGDGPSLYVGGVFTEADGLGVSGIARWNDGEWSDVGGGVSGPFIIVNDMIVWDDGKEQALYVAGRFNSAGGKTVNNIARWDGQSWSALGSGLNGTAYTLKIFNDELYVGGAFTQAGGQTVNHIARWNGSSWSSVGGGVSGSLTRVYAMDVLDPCDPLDPKAGACLMIGGRFTHAGGIPASNHAEWTGSEWLEVETILDGSVRAIKFTTDGPSGWDLYVGGSFTHVDEMQVNGIVHVNELNQMSALGSGLASFSGETAVLDIDTFISESGLEVIVAGQFSQAGGVIANNLARFNNGQWSQFRGGANGTVTDLHISENEFSNLGVPCANIVAVGAFSTVGTTAANRVAVRDECPTPLNNSLSGRLLIEDGVHNFSTRETTTDGSPEPQCDFSGDSQIHFDVWYEYIASCTGHLIVELCQSGYDTKLGIYELTPQAQAGSIMACDEVSCEGQQAKIVQLVNENEVFLFRVGGRNESAGFGIISIECRKLGDINGDGVVDTFDLLLLIEKWGSCPPGEICFADLNGDGQVDVFDLILLIDNWG